MHDLDLDRDPVAYKVQRLWMRPHIFWLSISPLHYVIQVRIENIDNPTPICSSLICTTNSELINLIKKIYLKKKLHVTVDGVILITRSILCMCTYKLIDRIEWLLRLGISGD